MTSAHHSLNFSLWVSGLKIEFFNRALLGKLLLEIAIGCVLACPQHNFHYSAVETIQRYFVICSPKRCNQETRTGSARTLSGIRQSWWWQNTFPRGKKSGKRSWALEWSHDGITVSYKGSSRKETFRVSELLDFNFPAEGRNSFSREDFLEIVVSLICNFRENPSLAGCRSWFKGSNPLPSKTHNVFSQAVSGSRWSNLLDGVCMISEPNAASGMNHLKKTCKLLR